MKLLEASNISKQFGALRALEDVSCSIETGEIVGLIGPNGAGKTTFFDVLSGFVVPSKGEVSFKGIPITGKKPHDICKLGLVRTFQIVKPFVNLTVLENVMAGAFNRCKTKKEARNVSVDILDFLNMTDKKRQLGKALPIASLTRLEIAKALATEPSLLLLDEVLAGLNDAERSELVEDIRRIRDKGITIFLIDHELQAVLTLCDRIIALNYGSKIADGPAALVVKEPELIKAYIGEELDIA